MDLTLGIDLGTSYFKLGLFDTNGRLCGLGRVEVAKDIPADGYCELPVDRFKALLNAGLEQACGQAKARPEDITATGYSSQANSFLLLDANSDPLTPLIIWPDQRAGKVYPELEELFAGRDFSQTSGFGLEPTPTLCVNKLLWFRENQPRVWQKTARVMTISDYLLFVLTGKNIGDAGTASLLGLTDVRNIRWQQAALAALGLKQEMLPNLIKPAATAGAVVPDNVLLRGVKPGTTTVAGSLDHHMAAIGAGAGTIADISESTGTVLACLSITGKFEPARGVVAGKGVSDTFWKLAFDNNGAANLEWYMKNHAAGFSFEELTGQAAEIPMGCEGLSAKQCASTYKGLSGFTGATSAHTHAHYFRALMESTALTLKELIEQINPGITSRKIAATGGGSKNNLWLQIKADITGMEIVTIDCEEPACRGAAMTAAVGCGWFESLQSVSRSWIRTQRTFTPVH